MKIVLPGGSGQVGTLLARAFHARGEDVVVLSRHAQHAPWRVVLWDGSTPNANWTREIDGADVVINLAGRSVNCRYTPENRRQILDSRVQSTHAIGQAIIQAKKPPRVWLQMSTATIYAHRFDAPNDEFSGILGGDEPNAPDTWRFSIQVAKAWEAAAKAGSTPGTRRVLLRAAMVMSPDKGGVFDTLLTLARRGLGGRAGSGKQFMSWIHHADFVRAIHWVIAHEELGGAVNLASPNPLPNAAFMLALRRACSAKIGLSTNELMIEIGTRLMQTESELILKSRRVVPAKLLQSGFKFEFPEWPSAVRDLVKGRHMRYR
jgi:uncharacterized protein (TIGR01777 family)